MKIGDTCSKPLVVTIGFFDGVHLGHRFLIKQVNEIARDRNYTSGVVTFSEHPRKVMQADFAPQLLNSCEEKISRLKASGVEEIVLLPFTLQLASLSARSFMQMLLDDYNVKALVIGYDHRFGRNRSEGFEDYCRYGTELGMEVILADVYNQKEITVSSSYIRKSLIRGDVSEAATCLGYEYMLQGHVAGGYQVGRRIGFPTANIVPDDPCKLIPSDGVYAVRVQLNGLMYNGMLSIGVRPTLENGPERSIEVHIFDFEGDIYDCTVCVLFVQRTRDEMKFDSLERLKAQLHEDEVEIRSILNK